MDIKPEDEVAVELIMRVEQVTNKALPAQSLISGWTRAGVYVIVPLSGVTKLGELKQLELPFNNIVHAA